MASNNKMRSAVTQQTETNKIATLNSVCNVLATTDATSALWTIPRALKTPFATVILTFYWGS
jgi:hypothetical protein